MDFEQGFEVVILHHSDLSLRTNMQYPKGINSQTGPVHFEDFSGHQFERLVVAFCVQRGWSNVEWLGQLGQDGGRDVSATDQDGRGIILLCANYRKLDLRKAGGDLEKIAKGEYQRPDHIIVVAGGGLTGSLRGDVKVKAKQLSLPDPEIWSGPEFEELIRKHAPLLLPRFCGGEPFPEAIDELRRWATTNNQESVLSLISEATPRFSKEALRLLQVMENAEDGGVLRSESHDGYSLTVDNRDFVSDTKVRREKARWDAALEELLAADFIVGSRDIFELTHKAYSFVESPMHAAQSEMHIARERFFALFSAHSLDTARINAICAPYGISVAVMESSHRLVDAIHGKGLKYISSAFVVCEEWLHGKDVPPARSQCQWYQNVGGAASKLRAYQKQGLDPKVYVVKRHGVDLQEARKLDYCASPENVGIVVSLERTASDGVSFRVYERWQFDKWNYEPVRSALKTLFYIARGLGIRMDGVSAPDNIITQVDKGMLLPVQIERQLTWFPEDYVDDHSVQFKDPDEFEKIKERAEDRLKWLRENS